MGETLARLKIFYTFFTRSDEKVKENNEFVAREEDQAYSYKEDRIIKEKENKKLTFDNEKNFSKKEETRDEKKKNKHQRGWKHDDQRERQYDLLTHEKRQGPFAFLFSTAGRELLMSDTFLVEQKRKRNSFLMEDCVVKCEQNCWTVSSKGKHIYAVIGRGKRDDIGMEDGMISYIYFIYTNYKQSYVNDLTYYVQADFTENTFKEVNIFFIDVSEKIWNFALTKRVLQKMLTQVKRSKGLCLILFSSILMGKYKLCVTNMVGRFRREKQGNRRGSTVFYLVEGGNAEGKSVDAYGKTKDGDGKTKDGDGKPKEGAGKPNDGDVQLGARGGGSISCSFLSRIGSIFSLLQEENVPFLKVYNLERYTRIFIYNCENMQRKIFINHLQKLPNFYIYEVNINTLFGLYFSETERNILRVFKKCQRTLKCTSKNVCLVIDGIDVIARGRSNKDDTGGSYQTCDVDTMWSDNTRKGEGGMDNDRLLTTLLLCLDSIDNCTAKKRSRFRGNSLLQKGKGALVVQKMREKYQKEGTRRRANDDTGRDAHEDIQEDIDTKMGTSESSDFGGRSLDGDSKGAHWKKKLEGHVTFFDLCSISLAFYVSKSLCYLFTEIKYKIVHIHNNQSIKKVAGIQKTVKSNVFVQGILKRGNITRLQLFSFSPLSVSSKFFAANIRSLKLSALHFIRIYKFIIYIRCLLEWLPQINPHLNPFVYVFTYTNSYVQFFHRYIPSVFGIDLSGVFSWLFLEMIEYYLS
ncbi:conserved Plasmodium protein, unknown function [Plasmodium ovale wallikeri]|uniref:Uncharacterized protein n=1 Tax=Plasmodium ovale wallikeri TaxID=864142 RepID=A0A1A8YS56_PLAOA|nr:conserved Plasmodium protein, unknown function [Plasmodium ovale wallikeri]